MLTEVEKKAISSRYIKEYGYYIDVLVATYNRLEYLKKTIWSLIASNYNSAVKVRIHVFDDKSTDGTNKWLDEMVRDKKIFNVVRHRDKMGTANTYNHLVSLLSPKKVKWFVISNDDMWYTSTWISRTLETIYKFPDCGIVNLYDYTALNSHDGKNSEFIDAEHLRVKTTGLGSSFINMALYLDVGGFYLPSGKYMGFFATNFCKTAYTSSLGRNRMYHIVPCVSYNMDRAASPFKIIIPEYEKFRKENKK